MDDVCTVVVVVVVVVVVCCYLLPTQSHCDGQANVPPSETRV